VCGGRGKVGIAAAAKDTQVGVGWLGAVERKKGVVRLRVLVGRRFKR
jgi:hypothetical protein